jgi:hypothetical protein
MRGMHKADVWARLVVHIMGLCEQSWCVMGAGVQDSVVHQVLVEDQQACLSSPVALPPKPEERCTDVSAASCWPDFACAGCVFDLLPRSICIIPCWL